VEISRETSPQSRVRGERGVVGAGAVASLEEAEEAVDLLGRDHRPGGRDRADGAVPRRRQAELAEVAVEVLPQVL
jgi:hypothetical protein